MSLSSGVISVHREREVNIVVVLLLGVEVAKYWLMSQDEGGGRKYWFKSLLMEIL